MLGMECEWCMDGTEGIYDVFCKVAIYPCFSHQMEADCADLDGQEDVR